MRAAVWERRQIAAVFSERGDNRLAQIALEGVDELMRDWQAHLRRDHPEEIASPGSLQQAFSSAERPDDGLPPTRG